MKTRKKKQDVRKRDGKSGEKTFPSNGEPHYQISLHKKLNGLEKRLTKMRLISDL